VNRLLTTLATIGRLAAPYFRSEDRWAGRMLLASVIVIELSLVAINVLLNQWNNEFYNALQDRDWNKFVYQLWIFTALAAAYIGLAVYQLYLNQWLQIRWRKWMTDRYLHDWLSAANHYRMQLVGDAADNPDQRISEDIRQFIELTLTIGVGLLSACVTLASFVVILWGLSAAAPLHLFGVTYNIPGYLVWAALIYALVGTVFTHLIGWRLAELNFTQQRYEADFRFNLVRVRENSEQIALSAGETAERERLNVRFGRVVDNWLAIMSRTKKLTFFTASYSQVSIIFPYVVVSPAYFSGAVQLGALMQTASAFSSVQTALSFFITAYRQLAEYQAVISRLAGFEIAIAKGRADAVTPPVIEVLARDGEPGITVEGLAVRLPAGIPLVTAQELNVRPGERVLLTGPSGSGKSTLFRALAGVWPFGAGSVHVPLGAKLMTLPQRPYFPVATLAEAVTYPAESGTFAADTMARALTAVGLGALVPRLDEEAHWNRMLSLGEQQRLAIARAILHVPDYLFLDEATASLDEASEADLYRLLQETLAGTTIISIGHRSTLVPLHRRQLRLVKDGATFRLEEKPAETAI
jgi:putative ATP-binding cassette transporter